MLVVDTSKVKHTLTESEHILKFNVGVAAMLVGLDAITEKNLIDWTIRLTIYEKLFGVGLVSKGGEPTSILPLLPRFVGTHFNVPIKTQAAFMKHMAQNLEDEIRRGAAA
jgi:hypothetical protein